MFLQTTILKTAIFFAKDKKCVGGADSFQWRNVFVFLDASVLSIECSRNKFKWHLKAPLYLFARARFKLASWLESGNGGVCRYFGGAPACPDLNKIQTFNERGAGGI